MSGQGPFQALPMEFEFLLKSIRNWSSLMEPCKELLILEDLFLSVISLS